MERSRLLTLSAFAIALPFAVLPAAAQAGSPTVSDEVRNGKIETTTRRIRARACSGAAPSCWSTRRSTT